MVRAADHEALTCKVYTIGLPPVAVGHPPHEQEKGKSEMTTNNVQTHFNDELSSKAYPLR